MKILLVDDHTLFRDGLRLVLHRLDKHLELDEAGNCEQATQKAGVAYDLVLLDWYMPGLDGLDALAVVRDTFPSTPVVVVSGEDHPSIVRRAIEGGAMGFIPKSSSSMVLAHALKLVVLAHEIYLPPAVLATPAYDLPEASAAAGSIADNPLKGLTERQMAVFKCVIKGKPNKVIARELKISEGTVKAHLGVVLRALGAANRTEAVYAAAKLGLRVA